MSPAVLENFVGSRFRISDWKAKLLPNNKSTVWRSGILLSLRVQNQRLLFKNVAQNFDVTALQNLRYLIHPLSDFHSQDITARRDIITTFFSEVRIGIVRD